MEKIHTGHNILINSKCTEQNIQEKTEIIGAMKASRAERINCFKYITHRLENGQISVEDFCSRVVAAKAAQPPTRTSFPKLLLPPDYANFTIEEKKRVLDGLFEGVGGEDDLKRRQATIDYIIKNIQAAAGGTNTRKGGVDTVQIYQQLYQIELSPGDGDCLYHSILSAATNRGLNWAQSINTLRNTPRERTSLLRNMLARVIEPDLTSTQLEALSPHERDVREQFYILGKDLVWGIWRRLVAGIGNGAVPAQYWGGSAEIQLVRLLFDVDILNYSATQKQLLWNGNGNSEDALVLYWRGLHYDWLMPTPRLQALISRVDLKLMENQPLPHVEAPELHRLYRQRLAAQQAEAASKQQPAEAEALAKQQAAAEALAKQQAAAEALAKQKAALQAQLRAHQEGEIARLIQDGQRLIGYLQHTFNQAYRNPTQIQQLIIEAKQGRKVTTDDRRHRQKALSPAGQQLEHLNNIISPAIERAQNFLDQIATSRITTNPFFGRLSKTKNTISQQTIPIAILGLLRRLLALRAALVINLGGGSRKRRRRRRKTRRNKKKRKKKTIKHRRKRGRKTRRK